MSRLPDDLSSMTDEELVDAVSSNVYEAGFHRCHSQADENCTALYREAVRREKPELYDHGYRRAARDAGVEP